MLDNHIFVVPIVVLIYIPGSFLITYGIALTNQHVGPAFPYISDTGVYPPESCIFGQLLNIGALLISIVVYTRYKQIEKFYRDKSRAILLRLNTGCFILGLLACLGLSLVANFQVRCVAYVHWTGALIALGVGGIYCYIQAGVSFRMMEVPGCNLIILIFRVVICVGHLISFVLFAVGFKWPTLVPNSTIAEWATAILIVIFTATFIGEFLKFKLQGPEVIFSEKRNTGYASNVIKPL